jgi:hypothetical protein
MHHWFDKIDGWLIDDVFQHISDFIQAHFNLTNFWLASQVMMFCLVMLLVKTFYHIYDMVILENHDLFFAVMISPFAAIIMLYLYRIAMSEDNRARNNRTSVMNNLRLTQYTWRVFVTVFMFFNMIFRFVFPYLENPIEINARMEIIGLMEDVGLFIFFYFLACTPRPSSWLKQTDRAYATASI